MTEVLVCAFCGKKAHGVLAKLTAAGWNQTDDEETGGPVWGCPACVVTKPALSQRAIQQRKKIGP